MRQQLAGISGWHAVGGNVKAPKVKITKQASRPGGERESLSCDAGLRR
jgi:hypothetical protein